MTHSIRPTAYTALISDYRFAIVETLVRRLDAQDTYRYDDEVFTAEYRFPA